MRNQKEVILNKVIRCFDLVWYVLREIKWSPFKPQFSSIVQPMKKIGLRTAELLLKRLEQGMNYYDPINIELKTIFTMTDSVADINYQYMNK